MLSAIDDDIVKSYVETYDLITLDDFTAEEIITTLKNRSIFDFDSYELDELKKVIGELESSYDDY